jgi:endonuclease
LLGETKTIYKPIVPFMRTTVSEGLRVILIRGQCFAHTRSMEITTFIELFEQSLAANHTLAFFCSCHITYSGRAESILTTGDRLIIVKSDNVLLIHQPEHGNPINYLKAGSELRLEMYEGHLLLRARSGKDYLDVEIFRVYDVMSKKLEDGQKQVLQGNERDMSDMIKDNPTLISADFIPLSREEHTKFGFIDVFGHDGNGNLVVVECKRYTASLACVTQLRRYVEKMKSLKGTQNVKGVMASPSISTNALNMLEEWGFSHVAVNPPKRLERHNKNQRSLDSF